MDYISDRMSHADPPPVPSGVTVLRDLVYAETPEQELQLDLYLPQAESDQPRPLIMYIHGGGWRFGNRHMLGNFDAQTLAQHGYVIAAIEYRLSSVAIFPAQIHDCKAALRWLRKNAEQYNLDPRRVGAFGGSAGGHLSSLLAVSAGVPELEGSVGTVGVEYEGPIQAVVPIMGVSDFRRLDDHRICMGLNHDSKGSITTRFLGGRIPDFPDLASQASPVTYLDRGTTPPFLIIHGEKDRVVPFGQSEWLHESLQAAGVPSELVPMPGIGHSYDGHKRFEVLKRIHAFFDLHLKGSSPN